MIIVRSCGLLAIACLASVTACALPPSNDVGYTPTTIRVPLAVTNDSPELVRVVFVSDGGHKFQIGTVGPHSTASLTAKVIPYLSGYLYAHRQSNDAATPLQGAFETHRLANRMVVVRIGSTPVFDYWHIAH